MRRSSRNIAFVLSLVFLLPLIWQSVHQVKHAFHHDCQGCPDELHFSLPKEECAICAYELARFEESSGLIRLPQLAVSAFFFHTEVTVCPESFRGFHFCLRVPPVC